MVWRVGSGHFVYIREDKSMFSNCFHFLFSFSCFQGKKKKTIFFFFFCFQNEKRVWLVFLKNRIQEIFLVVVFEKVEFCFLWLISFFKKLYLF